ncbi:glycerol-3-phosphate acyltransferase [Sporosarcina sp. Marseille-Q4063]|uniref:glycerol-3-phosphate acyltransferase n=1 Tax=Sporosarcina sp. Marseille-Q4063 TaxID=2810514 RepID=UPI001BAF3745|nr:glycerol-3-phosphate acyltransferase [Sporosarcina sp. Marseille-Q4063]QUW22422.1 glycerol-3-phosphate acyltransferase [Sporosarcina sp. Marseille-Q4063]
MWVWLTVLLCGGYFLGCLHGARIAQIISGVNLKTEGVKNFGASNATIVLGKKFGALVAAIDIGKGVLAVILARTIAVQSNLSDENSIILIFAAGAAVVLGHIFPFYMNFNGGKGTATVIGILFGINWIFGLIAFVVFVVVALVTDYLIFGVLMLYISLFIFAMWFSAGIWSPMIALSLFVIAILKHFENIQRMKKGDESRISAVFKKGKK